jgi:hypothetical protein
MQEGNLLYTDGFIRYRHFIIRISPCFHCQIYDFELKFLEINQNIHSFLCLNLKSIQYTITRFITYDN